MNKKRLFFSTYFEVDRSDIKSYGAIDISLINDTPLFIDPFLIFESDKNEYKLLNQGIVDYLKYLQTKQFSGTQQEFARLLHFGEVKQTWLGYSIGSNAGAGLGKKFAKSLIDNISRVLETNDEVKTNVHLEKLTLLETGVGKDRVSDFTANLIQAFLAEYTQEFARKYIDSSKLREFSVDKAVFDQSLHKWKPKTYMLPYYEEFGDYVLLTPRDILTKSDLWINDRELREQFFSLPSGISNEALRNELNDYISSIMPSDGKKPTVKELNEIFNKASRKYPILVDLFIQAREKNGHMAIERSEDEVNSVETAFSINAEHAIDSLSKTTFFDDDSAQDSFEAATRKINILKRQIENNDLYRIFYGSENQVIHDENDLQRLFKLVWAAGHSRFDANPETNHGRGPVDFTISRGPQDKTLIEFKLASNKQLERNLYNQLNTYRAADISTQESKKLAVIAYFSENELLRVNAILSRLKLDKSYKIIMIDARVDNKPSGSKA